MTTQSQYPAASGRVQTGWVGWIVFAGTMLMILGAFHIIQGLVALFRDEVYVVGPQGLVVNVDYTAWGWVHVIGGALAILTGACLLAGQLWARILAVVVAVVSALVNVAFLPAYPIWSTLMIALDVLVIWAVTVHGAEMKTPAWDATTEVPGSPRP
ncbi:membrane protein [Nocardioides endophyticus]|uniref:Membrane protein n=1 Tax=Nocardioides endophyticus TaxID=1353775 RepID=A0ABP8ZLH3_9ACTN